MHNVVSEMGVGQTVYGYYNVGSYGSPRSRRDTWPNTKTTTQTPTPSRPPFDRNPSQALASSAVVCHGAPSGSLRAFPTKAVLCRPQLDSAPTPAHSRLAARDALLSVATHFLTPYIPRPILEQMAQSQHDSDSVYALDA